MLNRLFDRVLRPRLHIFGRDLSSFHVFGVTGLVVAIALGIVLASSRGLALWVLLALAAVAVLTFLALAMLTKILTGGEKLVYYHQEIVVTLVAALFLGLVGQPVLAYVEIELLGIGTFLAFGRIGCTMVGCCHGRPHDWGVCYGPEYRNEEFPPYLMGVRLFPVQTLEAGLATFIVIIGSAMVLLGAAPGAAFAWYVVSYGLARFGLEYLRGDAVRPRIAGFSEAQWTSLILILLTVLAEWLGRLPSEAWHFIAAGLLVALMAALTIIERAGKPALLRLLEAKHIKEIAESVESTVPGKTGASNMGSPIKVARTSLGLQLSQGELEADGQEKHFYTVSLPGGTLDRKTAARLARLLSQLKHHGHALRILPTQSGAYHLIEE